jgi:HlyD family secretion protein
MLVDIYMISRRLILPLLAAFGLVLALYVAHFLIKPIPNHPPEYPPPIPTYENFVAGVGMVEASSENIKIGTPFGEVVDEVYVVGGSMVKKGDPLFAIDRQQKKAEEMAARFNVLSLLSDYSKQIAMPRKEEVPPKIKAVEIAKAELDDQVKQLELYESIKDQRAISQDALNQRRFAALKALGNYDMKVAELDLLQAGAWQFDIEASQAKLEEAKALLKEKEIAAERSIIRAPIDGMVLRVNVHPGESITQQGADEPYLLFGKVDPLMMRVNIDETDSWRVQNGAKAMAYVRGNSAISFPLEFLRIEPYLVPKKSLTGSQTERVDTRVLQVLFTFQKQDKPVYVGQLLDVYIEAARE